jgi:hypothetical protein
MVKVACLHFTNAGFSAAMAVMRLLGDALVEKLNACVIVVGGGLLAAGKLLLAIFSPTVYLVPVGFILSGIGAANIYLYSLVMVVICRWYLQR